MADSNVLKAQKYLNAMFGGHPSWKKLDEDGYTGSGVMEGIIRAFQIQNGLTNITGTVGPITISTMKKLPIIEKMNPDDTSSVNVCLIQCALFCKGYNAGGITGVYYTTGVSAVREMQGDAGLQVTGKIDWKVWAGLLSMNWFKKVSGGDNITQLIQRQLNSDWSDIIGVGPCDGVVSRQTALSLVGALQAAEGVTTELITDLNSVNFGNATTAAFKTFPGSLKNEQNSSAYIPFNKLVQYGLYFNGYNPSRFDGIFDTTTSNKVSDFQKFYGLTGIGLVTLGEVNVSTMKSLLTSKGDTERKAKACDCATVLNRQQAKDIKAAGYTHVGRYLTGSVGSEHIPKFLTLDEIENIKAAGLHVFPIYQDGGYYLEYFQKASQGSVDAQTAILAAERIGIPKNSTIYFAVDFLTSTTKSLLDSGLQDGKYISAKNKNVIVIGGGDTGNDCVGTCIRHGCKSITQLEMMPKAPDTRAESNPWPQWPLVCKTDYGQEEAIAVFGHDPRIYQTTVKEFLKDKNGNLTGLITVKLEAKKDEKTGRMNMVPVEGSEQKLDADLVLIAAGFLGTEKYVADAFGVKLNARTNVETEEGRYKTNVKKVFTAGDMHRGQSLVVWAIREGREAAREVDESLMGYSYLSVQ